MTNIRQNIEEDYQASGSANGDPKSKPLNVIRFGHRKRCFESDLGNDPHIVNFPFAFSVAFIILIGFMFGFTGIVASKGGMFLFGMIVILIGLWLYGWSLYAEGK